MKINVPLREVDGLEVDLDPTGSFVVITDTIHKWRIEITQSTTDPAEPPSVRYISERYGDDVVQFEKRF